jgi:hypothetical protein
MKRGRLVIDPAGSRHGGCVNVRRGLGELRQSRRIKCNKSLEEILVVIGAELILLVSSFRGALREHFQSCEPGVAT